jgi:Flp pilus assembly protein TadD
MKPTQSGRRPSQIAAALGAMLVTASCANLASQKPDTADLSGAYDGDSGQLLRYCSRLHERGDLVLAAGMCERAHQLDPANPEPLMELATILTELQRPEQTAEAYRRILQTQPDHVEARYALGKTYIALGHYDLALGEFRTALEADSKDPRLYNALGVANGLLGAHTAAQEIFRSGLLVAPRDVSLRNNLGLSLVLSGQHREGLALLNELASSPSANQTTLRNLQLAQGIASTRVAEAEIAALEGRGPGDDLESQVEIALLPVSEEEAAGLDADAPAPDAEAMAAMQSEPLEPPRFPSTSPVFLAEAFAWPDRKGPGIGRGVIHGPDPVTHGAPPRLAQAAPGIRERRAARRPIPIIVQTARAPMDEATDADAPSGYMGDYLSVDVDPAGPPTQPVAPFADMQEDSAVGGYAIQFASYKSEERARQGWETIQAAAGDLLQSIEPVVRRADLGPEKGIFYRLRARPTSRAAAEALCRSLAARGVDCLIVEEAAAMAEAPSPAR